MKILITGGSKNGKSSFAQGLIEASSSVGTRFYIATMMPSDGEDLERIERHKKEREGCGFITIEQPQNINDDELMKRLNAESSVLLDSTTALLANEMFLPKGGINENATKKVIDGLTELSFHVKNIAVVSDYIYSDAAIYDSFTEKYRFGLASIDRALAQIFDTVVELSFGNIIYHKGRKDG